MNKQNSRQKPAARRISEVGERTVLTTAMVNLARAIAADERDSIALLKRAGILNRTGRMSKEYIQ